MASECPKMIDSGGISPIDCTKELTEFVVVMCLALVKTRQHPDKCTLHAKPETS